MHAKETDMYYDSIEVYVPILFFHCVMSCLKYVRAQSLLDIMKSELATAPGQGKVFPIYEWSMHTLEVCSDVR